MLLVLNLIIETITLPILHINEIPNPESPWGLQPLSALHPRPRNKCHTHLRHVLHRSVSKSSNSSLISFPTVQGLPEKPQLCPQHQLLPDQKCRIQLKILPLRTWPPTGTAAVAAWPSFPPIRSYPNPPPTPRCRSLSSSIPPCESSSELCGCARAVPPPPCCHHYLGRQSHERRVRKKNI